MREQTKQPSHDMNDIQDMPETIPLSADRRDRVNFLNWASGVPAVGSARYLALPLVRLVRDWGSYAKGDVMVVYQQMNNGNNGTRCYRGMLDGETLPEGELGGRVWPAEIAEPVFRTLRGAINHARDYAVEEARRDYRFVRSRGTYLATSDGQGQCRPHEAADCHDWRGSQREINEAIAECLKDYPEVQSIYIAGGYDGGGYNEEDTFKDFLKGDTDYQPWASSFEVTAWTREGGIPKYFS